MLQLNFDTFDNITISTIIIHFTIDYINIFRSKS